MKAYTETELIYFAQFSLVLTWSFLLCVKLPRPQHFRQPLGTQLVAIPEVLVDLVPGRLSGMGPVRLVGSSSSAEPSFEHMYKGCYHLRRWSVLDTVYHRATLCDAPLTGQYTALS